MINPELTDKVVLITGANHGIGKATTKSLAVQGAKIFATCYRPGSRYSEEELKQARRAGTGGSRLYEAMQHEPIEALAQEIKETGGSVATLECDLANTENVPLLFDTCEKELGPVDILINNHAHCVLETFDPFSVSDDDFTISLTDAEGIDRHFAVNARASALMMREYLQRYIDRDAKSGRIINLTTVLGHARNISYAASKRALVSYSMSAAQEMGKYGITVNVVCPGATQTGYIPPQDEPGIVRRTPLGRLGQPEDIADIITFLASKQAGWLTGQLIYASGGFLMFMDE